MSVAAVERFIDSTTIAPPEPEPRVGDDEREQRRAERRHARQVEHWLAHRAIPDGAILWYPGWSEIRPIVVSGPRQLGALIASLADARFGGLQRHRGDGPWAQAKNIGDSSFLLELHPWVHGDDEGGEGMYFERVVPVHAQRAAALAWAWVRREPLPADAVLEQRVAPANGAPDGPL